MDKFCPRCGTGRIGALRFCRGCRFDFDALPSEEPVSPAVAAAAAGPTVASAWSGRRLTGRRALVGGLAVLFGLGALGSLAKDPATSPAVATSSTPTPPATTAQPTSAPAAIVAPATIAPTPVATPEPTFGPSGPTETARVVRVIDGDTIAVDIGGTEHKLRYIGMDTPETVDPNSPVEWMGPQAAAANAKLVDGKDVVLERDASETDRYGRLLRHVWLTDGASWTLVSLELVRLGVATAVSYPPDVKYDDLFREAEDEARSAIVGLWGPAPTPKPTPKPTPRPTPTPTKKPSNCHPSYLPCLPIVGDLDCPDVRAMGKAPVEVIGPDEYRLDRDNDGLGCE